MPLHPSVAARIRQVAIASLTPAEAATVHLSLSADSFPAGHVFKLPEGSLTVPVDAALLFIDRQPGANWGHACTYRFVDPVTGRFLRDQDALFPPDLGGDIGLAKFHAPALPSRTAASLARVPSGRVRAARPATNGAGEQRYAILWTSQISNLRHVEDLEFFWRTLVNVAGFDPANIYVLCYNGSIGATDVSGAVGNWAGNDTPYQMKVYESATVANLQAVFNTLSARLQPSDLLLVHTNNHGAPSGLCVDANSVITPAQFGAMLAPMPAFGTLIVTMEQCYSGAFQAPVIQNSKAKQTVFASAVTASEVSAGAAHFDPWALDLIEALNGATPAGATLPSKPVVSPNGGVSIKAACDWARTTDTGVGDDPQYADNPAGCGSNIFLTAAAGWQHNDLTLAAGNAPPAAGDPSGYTWSVDRTEHAIYRGTDNHVHELWFNGAWHHNDLTVAAGNAPPAASSPRGYTWSVDNTEHAIYRGADNHIHELWFNGAWHHNDLTAAAGNAPLAAADPAGYTWSVDKTQHVLYRGVDNHIHELWFNGAWHHNDLTAASGNPPLAASNPAGYTWDVDKTEHCLYRGVDNHIHELWFNGAWHHNDLTAAAGNAPLAAGDPCGYTWSSDKTEHAVYRGLDNHIHELWFNGTWHHNDLTAAAGNAPLAASDPAGYTWSVDNTEHVLYRSADGHVHELWFNGSWHQNDLTVAAGNAPPAVRNPAGYTWDVDGTEHALYCGEDGHIHELWL
jgi:hypothetical protein